MRSRLLIALAVSIALGPRWAAAAERVPPAAPSVSLSAYGRQTLERDPQAPLLLTVELDNPQAVAARLHNAETTRVRAEMERSPDWTQMSKRRRAAFGTAHPLAAMPALTLGTPARPVWDLILFAITDPAGQSRFIPGRPLSATLMRDETVTLDGQHRTSLAFGVEPAVLGEFPDGRYELRAVIDARQAPQGWRGQAASPPVVVTLARSAVLSAEEANRQDYRSGQFYLLDEQYDEAARVAQRMLARDRGSLDALRLLGELQLAQGAWDDAQHTFERAIASFRRRHRAFWQREGPPPPDDLLRRLQEIQQRHTR